MILNSSACFLNEFQDTLKVVSVKQFGGQQSPSPAEVLSWISPLVGCLKLNSDMSIRKDLSFAGVLSAISRELLALREGQLLAQELGLKVSWVECDAAYAVSTMLDKDPCFGLVGLVVSNVRVLCKIVGVVKYLAISRKRNGLSHTLASLDCSSVDDRF
ncbi:hypothetical protein JRO89_XS03G0145500 [Xanthoceras sorbifolium]|uniref:RNase H type-1 domain-containing protein n=1 Tax=Xanthoceras sorbifolium TaxID=99658 RepID=A0ABQ8IAG8_9ROSI|nr:hypothetical protein JRO89_XS03G0145500 [Xanthoceras sorbifolium]